MGTRVTGGNGGKKKCPLCKGTGKLPWSVAKELPKPSRNIQCTRCKGKKVI